MLLVGITRHHKNKKINTGCNSQDICVICMAMTTREVTILIQ